MGNESGLSEYLGSRFSKHVTEIVLFCRIFNGKVYDGKEYVTNYSVKLFISIDILYICRFNKYRILGQRNESPTLIIVTYLSKSSWKLDYIGQKV